MHFPGGPLPGSISVV